MAQPIANQPSSTAQKRRSRRFPFISPVEATWQEANGKIFREAGQATEVNAQGGLLEMKTYPAAGTQIELTNLVTHETSQARVVGVRRNSEGRLLGVAVELFVPSETFWGMNLQLKKTCADLVRLEYEMRSGPFDPRILRVLPLLAAEGIRRATQLCDTINTGLAAHEVARETVGIDEFFQAVERVHQSLLDLLKDRQR